MEFPFQECSIWQVRERPVSNLRPAVHQPAALPNVSLTFLTPVLELVARVSHLLCSIGPHGRHQERRELYRLFLTSNAALARMGCTKTDSGGAYPCA